MSNPLVVICLLTYRRTDYAIRAIEGIQKNLNYDNWAWYIADAGSAIEHLDIIRNATKNDRVIHSHSSDAVMPPYQNWNTAISWSLKQTPFYIRLEDDFVLERELKLERYVHLLEQRQEVGLVRFGLMPINLEMESMGFEGDLFMNIYKTRQYCYSGHPHLTHARFHEAYGLFPAADRPGDCELAMDGMVHSRPGPQVWWPLDAKTWGFFGHIGKEKA